MHLHFEEKVRKKVAGKELTRRSLEGEMGREQVKTRSLVAAIRQLSYTLMTMGSH